MKSYLVVIPAYNEALNMEVVLAAVLDQKLPADILVVNDGSTDHTYDVVRRIMTASQGVRMMLISHPYNLGYGAALQTGYKYALQNGYDYVLQFDSDNQHKAMYLHHMIAHIEETGKDVVIGSRFLQGTYRTGVSKSIAIVLMRFLIKLATGTRITDPTSGMKALSKKVMLMFDHYNSFPSDYPDADIIIEMGRRGLTLSEIPITINERTFGKSMHSGLKPIVYILNMLIGISVVVLRDIFMKERL